MQRAFSSCGQSGSIDCPAGFFRNGSIDKSYRLCRPIDFSGIDCLLLANFVENRIDIDSKPRLEIFANRSLRRSSARRIEIDRSPFRFFRHAALARRL
jgi:hypothetical protein